MIYDNNFLCTYLYYYHFLYHIIIFVKVLYEHLCITGGQKQWNMEKSKYY